jgi:hypothetical protein
MTDHGAKLCPKCQQRALTLGQRWCGPCRTEHRRTRKLLGLVRARKAVQRSGERSAVNGERRTGSAPSPENVGDGGIQARSRSPKTTPAPPGPDLPPFVPYLHRDDVTRPGWADDYLRALAAMGRHELAAAAASIHSAEARHYRETNGHFADEAALAVEYYRDSLEAQLRHLGVTKSNPLPFFGLLKSERPARWVEKSIVLTADATPEITPDHAKRVLADMLTHLTPATREDLAGRTDSPIKMIPPAATGEPWAPPTE